MRLTCTMKSISSESLFTLTCEATCSVDTLGLTMAASVVYCTLVDVCNIQQLSGLFSRVSLQLRTLVDIYIIIHSLTHSLIHSFA